MNYPSQGVDALPRATARSPRSASLFLAGGFAILAALVVAVPTTAFLADMMMAAVLLAVPLIYAVRRLHEGTLDIFEMIVPVSILFFAYFGWSTVYLKLFPDALQRSWLAPYLTPALGLSLAGFLAMWLGYLTMFRKAAPARIARLAPARPGTVIALGVLGFMGEMFGFLQETMMNVSGTVSGIYSIGQQFRPLFILSWFLVWYVFWAKTFPRGASVRLIAVFVPLILADLVLFLGGKEHAIVLAGTPAVAFWYVRRRFPWKSAVALLLVLVFVVFPVYNTFRFVDYQVGTVGRLGETLEIASEWDRQAYLDQSVEGFLRRIALITSVAAVVRDVGVTVDYRYGETLYLALIGFLVPRVIWPDKPNIAIGREFGWTFGLVHTFDSVTYVAPTMVGELYWNFHIPGALIGMFVFGAVLRLLQRKFGSVGTYAPIAAPFHFLLLRRMMHFEGNVAGVVAGAARSVVVIYLTLHVLERIGWLGWISERGPDAGQDGNEIPVGARAARGEA